MAATFQRIQSRFGVFAVLGNHEYIGRQTETAVELLRKSGIIVLRDSFVNVADRFVVAGREEWDRTRFGYGPRKSLKDLLKGVNAKKPVLLMDHQPRNLAEPADAGVDLQVSGHTHRGQLFPNQWLTGALYEIDHGYLRKGKLQVIVSAGFGTWGPPVRTSAASEIVEIKVVFQP
jgi:predicted MPP superfamily phosphohydrolase